MKNTSLFKKLSFTTILFLFVFTSISYAQYDGYKRNSDGSYSVGGAYDGYKRNSDGSYSVGWGPCRK